MPDFLQYLNYFDVNVFVYLVLAALFVWWCIGLFWGNSYLMDLDYFNKMTLADIEDQAANYWAVEYANRQLEEQKRYCFKKVHESMKAVSELNREKEIKEINEVTVRSKNKDDTLPDNVVILHS